MVVDRAAAEPWGMRRWICELCRTVLPADEHYADTLLGPMTELKPCAAAHHKRLIDLDAPDGHAELARRTWPQPIGRIWRKLRRGQFLSAFRRIWIDLRRLTRKPSGSFLGSIDLGDGGLTGTIRSARRTPPFGGVACAAYGLALLASEDRTLAVLIRDGWTTGLSIELDDGRTVRVPAGRIVVSLREAESLDESEIDRYLEWLGIPPPVGRRPVVPAEHGKIVRLRDGDRVTLRAELVPDSVATDYRTAAPLRTRGVPVFVPIVRAKTDVTE